MAPTGPLDERRVATSERLRDRVVFIRYVPERMEALALVGTCDIAFADCWSPAGFPLKLFEYMALGRAIIVEGKEQMREVLREGEHCAFYRSVDELANAIIALCEDEPGAGDSGKRPAPCSRRVTPSITGAPSSMRSLPPACRCRHDRRAAGQGDVRGGECARRRLRVTG